MRQGKFVLVLVKRLDHADQSSERGLDVTSAITCILPLPQTVYTGDEDGRVVSQLNARCCEINSNDVYSINGIAFRDSDIIPKVTTRGD